MYISRTRSQRLRSIETVIVLFVVAACHGWSTTETPTPARQLAGNPQRARVVLTDGSTILVKNPSISADTLIGTADLAGTDSVVRVAIPMTRIKTLEVPKLSFLRTTGFIIVVAVAAFAAYVFWIFLNLDNNY